MRRAWYVSDATSMNFQLALLTLCQGLFLVNNVTFIAINGLVGLSLAPAPWMATLPLMGYVVGGALSTVFVGRHHRDGAASARFRWALRLRPYRLPCAPTPY